MEQQRNGGKLVKELLREPSTYKKFIVANCAFLGKKRRPKRVLKKCSLACGTLSGSLRDAAYGPWAQK